MSSYKGAYAEIRSAGVIGAEAGNEHLGAVCQVQHFLLRSEIASYQLTMYIRLAPITTRSRLCTPYEMSSSSV